MSNSDSSRTVSRTISEKLASYAINRHNHGKDCECPTCIAGRDWIWGAAIELQGEVQLLRRHTESALSTLAWCQGRLEVSDGGEAPRHVKDAVSRLAKVVGSDRER